MQVEGPRHIRDRGPASDSFAWLYFPRHNFGIWKEWYSCTTCVSICNDIRPAAGLLFQVFLKHCCLRFEPTFKNKLSKGKEAELRLLRGHPYSLLCSIFQSQFWTFMLCNVIIFYESRYLKKKKLRNGWFRDWVVLSEITMEFWPLWKDLHPIIRQLILKPMVRAIFSHLFGAHVVKCKTSCCLLMLQIFKKLREPLVLPLLSSLSKKRRKKSSFPQEFSNWENLEHN